MKNDVTNMKYDNGINNVFRDLERFCISQRKFLFEHTNTKYADYNKPFNMYNDKYSIWISPTCICDGLVAGKHLKLSKITYKYTFKQPENNLSCEYKYYL
jgi:hypothetical protein